MARRRGQKLAPVFCVKCGGEARLEKLVVRRFVVCRNEACGAVKLWVRPLSGRKAYLAITRHAVPIEVVRASYNCEELLWVLRLWFSPPEPPAWNDSEFDPEVPAGIEARMVSEDLFQLGVDSRLQALQALLTSDPLPPWVCEWERDGRRVRDCRHLLEATLSTRLTLDSEQRIVFDRRKFLAAAVDSWTAEGLDEETGEYTSWSQEPVM